ncbi:MAG: LysR family transcriptional regulator, partial [Suipraeoptans sp.]
MFEGMEYIYEVYKEKSFSKASKNLFISQPSLSASVKRIEDKIGYKIFNRNTKPIGLTECGKHYVAAIERIMEIEEAFRYYLNDWDNLKTGILTIGGSSMFTSFIIPEMVDRYKRKFSGIKVEIVEENASKLEQLLQTGEIDLIIGNT